MAAAIVLACATPTLAQAPPPSQGSTAAPAAAPNAAASQRTELVLCNKTGSTIQVAVAYVNAQTNRWMLSAWHTRQPGECKTFASIKTGLFYYHAKNERGTVWPAAANTDRRYCVPNTAVTRDMSSQCGAGEQTRNFRGQSANPGKYTFSFS